jgi:tripartite-type tricarboxylate transporter receptor subunit TctC
MRICSVILTATCGFLVSGGAAAQSYPTKPVRIVVPFPAGGGTDIFARLIGKRLSETLAQGFLIDNRAGASGMIGCELVARSAPDGYTLVMATTGTHATNPAVYTKMSYDPVKDFAPISLVAESPFVLLVHPSLPATNVKELIALAKTKPGQLTYASAGVGSSSHLGFELFNLMAGITGVHVPYKGLPPATADAIAGNVAMTWDSITASAPFIREKRIRALGIGSARRSALMPEIPTISESGLKGFELGSWYALFAPRGTPRDVVQLLHDHVVKGLGAPGMREQFAALGAEPVGGTPDSLAETLRHDLAKWARVAREANVRAE